MNTFATKCGRKSLARCKSQHARDDSDLALASELWGTYDGGPGKPEKYCSCDWRISGLGNEIRRRLIDFSIADAHHRQQRVEYSHSCWLVAPQALPEPGAVVSAIASYRVLV
jgi:hypothetical protein